MRNGTANKLNIIFVVLLIISIFLLFVSCNRETENPGEYLKDLYIVDKSFNEDEQIMTVVIGFAGQEEKKLPDEVSARIYSEVFSDGAFYKESETEITVNGTSIFSAVNNMLTQDEKIYNGMEYSCLKVEFQYATIYKSIISKGIISKQGKYYVHRFMIDETASDQTISLVQRQQNSAAWYGTLAGCAVAVMLIVSMVCVIIRRKNGKQN
ncbi:MAG: hypothetical protein MJ068_01250 [Clostridia bacterium]|nr:hypothetical protein [Clostridia bacterium]